jgi:hypothetical protein
MKILTIASVVTLGLVVSACHQGPQRNYGSVPDYNAAEDPSVTQTAYTQPQTVISNGEKYTVRMIPTSRETNNSGPVYSSEILEVTRESK